VRTEPRGAFFEGTPGASVPDLDSSGTPIGLDRCVEGVVSNLHASNAFDGETDELGITAGSLGVDSWSWSFSEWLDDGFQAAEVSSW